MESHSFAPGVCRLAKKRNEKTAEDGRTQRSGWENMTMPEQSFWRRERGRDFAEWD